jgi:hypothetical protein
MDGFHHVDSSQVRGRHQRDAVEPARPERAAESPYFVLDVIRKAAKAVQNALNSLEGIDGNMKRL